MLLLIDSYSLIHRAFHALPPLKSKSGQPSGAIYGFCLVFFKAIREMHPSHLAVAFDTKKPSFRKEIFCDYKAKRKTMADDFYSQIPIIKDILSAMGINVFEKEGFEADDIIATLARLGKKENQNIETIILSTDTDFLQLVDKNIKIIVLKKGISQTIIFDEKGVGEKYSGMRPDQLIDFKALRGDPTDNIPGVIGIGEKTATELIMAFGDLDNLYRQIESGETNNLRKNILEKIISQKDRAFMSRELAMIKNNVDIEFNLQSCAWGGYNKEKVRQLISEIGFFSLISKLP